MHRRFRPISVLILALLSMQAWPDPFQPDSLNVTFPGVGEITTTIHIGVGTRPEVEFQSKGARLLAFPLGDAGPPDPESATHPRGQALFRVIPGLPTPIIAVAVRNEYGTGFTDHLALVGIIGGKLTLLHMPWEISNLGGFHLGPLNATTPVGVAVWNFNWADCHACPNPYEIISIPWDADAQRFLDHRGSITQTTKRYEGPEDVRKDLFPSYVDFMSEFNDLNE
jgi:hypothetical protein